MKSNPIILFVDLSINAYRYFVSPILPHSCRFYPSCSEYALQAFRKYGFLKGSRLTFKRLTKCHPLSAGGYDPIS